MRRRLGHVLYGCRLYGRWWKRHFRWRRTRNGLETAPLRRHWLGAAGFPMRRCQLRAARFPLVPLGLVTQVPLHMSLVPGVGICVFHRLQTSSAYSRADGTKVPKIIVFHFLTSCLLSWCIVEGHITQVRRPRLAIIFIFLICLFYVPAFMAFDQLG